MWAFKKTQWAVLDVFTPWFLLHFSFSVSSFFSTEITNQPGGVGVSVQLPNQSRNFNLRVFLPLHLPLEIAPLGPSPWVFAALFCILLQLWFARSLAPPLPFLYNSALSACGRGLTKLFFWEASMFRLQKGTIDVGGSQFLPQMISVAT